jgi:hypothetical protein
MARRKFFRFREFVGGHPTGSISDVPATSVRAAAGKLATNVREANADLEATVTYEGVVLVDGARLAYIPDEGLLAELAAAVDDVLPALPAMWAGCWPSKDGPCPCHMHQKRRRLERALAAAKEVA